MRFRKGVVRLVRFGDSHDFGLLPSGWVMAQGEARVVDVNEVVLNRVPTLLQ
jgi:hypothetical protein